MVRKTKNGRDNVKVVPELGANAKASNKVDSCRDD